MGNSPNSTVKSRTPTSIVKIKHLVWPSQLVKSELPLVNHALILSILTWIPTQLVIPKITPFQDITLSNQQPISHQNQPSVETIFWEVPSLSSRIVSMDLRTSIVTGPTIKWVSVWLQISTHQLVMKLNSGLVTNTFSTFKKTKTLLSLIWDVLTDKVPSSNMVTSKLVMNDLDINSEQPMNSLMMNVVPKLVTLLLDLTSVIKVTDKLIRERPIILE